MAPPKFDDLGKQAKDLFSKGYNFGFLKVDTKTKTSDGLEFKTNAQHNTGTARLFGSVDIKYKFKDYGLTVTEKWNTDNSLGAEVLIEDRFAKGLKITFDSTYAPNLGKRNGKLKLEHGVDNAFSEATLDIATRLLTIGVVAGRDGFLGGAQLSGDATQQKLQRHTIAAGYKKNEYGLFAFVSDLNDFSGSVYHKASDRLELAATAGWNSVDQTTRFGIASQYQMDNATQLRAKVSNQGTLGLAMTHTLKPGLKLILSSLVNLQTFNEGGHKVGLGIEYEQ